MTYKIGDLIGLSQLEKEKLFNDGDGYSAEEINEWNIGIVLCHVPIGAGDFEECDSYKVKWFPSGDIIEEVDHMIMCMGAEPKPRYLDDYTSQFYLPGGIIVEKYHNDGGGYLEPETTFFVQWPAIGPPSEWLDFELEMVSESR